MPQLALNFICKDESHVVGRLLESVKSITDLIVVNDTGSTDGTQEIIRRFGAENDIPTYVFERPFDDFGHSRHYALQKLKEVVQELHWNPEDVWGYWADCDERLIIDPAFTKAALDKDMYNVAGEIDRSPFARGSLFRLSRDFYWYGPVHEALMWKDPFITSARLPGLYIVSEKVGYSWKGDLAAKYLRYAEMLEDFISSEDRGGRWVFYTAQSYFTAADFCTDETDSLPLYSRALKYYEERVSIYRGGSPNRVELEERYFAQFQVGVILNKCGESWPFVQEALLRAYGLDPLRAEAFLMIIQHYENEKDWTLAYFFSRFSVDTFHGKSPLGQRFIGV